MPHCHIHTTPSASDQRKRSLPCVQRFHCVSHHIPIHSWNWTADEMPDSKQRRSRCNLYLLSFRGDASHHHLSSITHDPIFPWGALCHTLWIISIIFNRLLRIDWWLGASDKDEYVYTYIYYVYIYISFLRVMPYPGIQWQVTVTKMEISYKSHFSAWILAPSSQKIPHSVPIELQ